LKYKVEIKKSILKKLPKLPEQVKDKLDYLIDDLREHGAIRRNWKNFSVLGNHQYHCHLNYDYVACWKWKKKTIYIEVYYVGSRESAPY
jgi:mRNA-degrading endonuclease YafQ of YafQ-DinJ toxin-antitoxin module